MEKGRKRVGVDYRGFTVDNIVHSYFSERDAAQDAGQSTGQDAEQNTVQNTVQDAGQDVHRDALTPDDFSDVYAETSQTAQTAQDTENAAQTSQDTESTENTESTAQSTVQTSGRRSSAVPDRIGSGDQVGEQESRRVLAEASEEADEYSDMRSAAIFGGDDEEELLRSDDMMLEDHEDSFMVAQPEDTVSVFVNGMFNDSGKVHNGLYLRENPPIMTFADSSGNEASIILTKDLTRGLHRTLGTLNKGYMGYSMKRGESKLESEKSSLSDLPEWAGENPVKALMSAVLILGMFIILVMALFS